MVRGASDFIFSNSECLRGGIRTEEMVYESERTLGLGEVKEADIFKDKCFALNASCSSSSSSGSYGEKACRC
jgi:hypothetical protein